MQNDITPPITHGTDTIASTIKNYVKVAVRTKGCSGNAYTLDWVREKAKLDEEVSVADGTIL